MATTAERFGDKFGGEKMWGLQELPYPDAVAFTPQTAGWLLVAALLVGLFLWLAIRWRRRWKLNEYRRIAISEIDRIRTSPESAAQLPFILRKVALVSYKREDVASLRGAEWMTWLNSTAENDQFSEGDAELLDRLAYSDQKVEPELLIRLVKASRTWVGSHRA
jgi:hypothetical protein